MPPPPISSDTHHQQTQFTFDVNGSEAFTPDDGLGRACQLCKYHQVYISKSEKQKTKKKKRDEKKQNKERIPHSRGSIYCVLL